MPIDQRNASSITDRIHSRCHPPEAWSRVRDCMASPGRDDFPDATKRALAARANTRCSNPGCRAPTSGPQEDSSKAVNVGVAAHITAAAPGGPRHDASLSPEDRGGISNGIWLCQNCAKRVDNDTNAFNAATLRRWKDDAEQEARETIGKPVSPVVATVASSEQAIFQRIGESSPSDWSYYDPEATYRFKPDVALRIVHQPVETLRQFPEAWAHRFPDPSAVSLKFTIYYHATPIKDEYAVAVDGGRAYIPYPKSASVLTITRWQYTFAQIIHLSNSRYDLDDYLERSGIVVSDAA